ncbi:27371_t:CDS:2, partial [Gigaspora margarita]
QSNKEKEQNKNINLVTVESSEKEEVYITRPQPYTKDQKEAKDKQKQSEPRKKEALRKKAEIQEQEETYLADSCEKDKILFNVNEKLEKEQFGWENSINDEPHEIYIKLDDLISQHKATLEKEVSITTWSLWLQPTKTPTEAYYSEFDNFKDTYF